MVKNKNSQFFANLAFLRIFLLDYVLFLGSNYEIDRDLKIDPARLKNLLFKKKEFLKKNLLKFRYLKYLHEFDRELEPFLIGLM